MDRYYKKEYTTVAEVLEKLNAIEDNLAVKYKKYNRQPIEDVYKKLVDWLATVDETKEDLFWVESGDIGFLSGGGYTAYLTQPKGNFVNGLDSCNAYTPIRTYMNGTFRS